MSNDGRIHVHLRLLPHEYERLCKHCVGYGSKTDLIRRLLKRFFDEREAFAKAKEAKNETKES